jgi:tRNA (cytidine/uridine-2'-O-)-methyltransferase
MARKTTIDVALFRPEIPANTGNIGRLCVGSNSTLHIVGRPAFLMRDKDLKRAGLDYWDKLSFIKHEDENSFLEYSKEFSKEIVVISKFAKTRYDLFNYEDKDIILLLGRESDGLEASSNFNKEMFDNYESVYIPMSENIRSLNLSNSAAVVLYEALKFNSFTQIT